MWLINTATYALHEFVESSIPVNQYAILSHRWEEEEISFNDIRDPLFVTAQKEALCRSREATSVEVKASTDVSNSLSDVSFCDDSRVKKGWRKISDFCDKAASRGITWGWVDTCCIDKSSSAELSEAINSMYRWYRKSKICFVYLSDASSSLFKEMAIPSDWFSRGWTLQELLAPLRVEFFDHNWDTIGTRKSLRREIFKITRIPLPLLHDSNMYELNWCSIAQRMSWMGNRQTTRDEDMAYCLLGIFDVHMPLIYGEGLKKAFYRLQREILENSDDESIFAFADGAKHYDEKTINPEGASGVLAESPAKFRRMGHVRKVEDVQRKPFAMTHKGLRIELEMYSVYDFVEGKDSRRAFTPHSNIFFLARLGCLDGKGNPLCFCLRKAPQHDGTYIKLGLKSITSRSSIQPGKPDTKEEIIIRHTPLIQTSPLPAHISWSSSITEDFNARVRSLRPQLVRSTSLHVLSDSELDILDIDEEPSLAPQLLDMESRVLIIIQALQKLKAPKHTIYSFTELHRRIARQEQ